MQRRILKISLLLFFIGLSAGAQQRELEGNFQVNTLFMTTSYPLFGTGGTDLLNISSVGFTLKSSRGAGLHGVLDFGVLFPYSIKEKNHPQSSFSSRGRMGPIVGVDIVAGMGYSFDVSPMVILASVGFHSGILVEGLKYLLSFGINLDTQILVQFAKVFSAQAGVKFNVDFAGTQRGFSDASNFFAGFPLGIGFYVGMGLHF